MSIFLAMSAVNAEDVNGTDIEAVSEIDDNMTLEADVTEDVVEATSTQKASFLKVNKNVYVKGENFYIKVVNAKNSPLVGKSVKFTFNGKSSNAVTNKNGYAGLPLSVSKGQYTIKYAFSEKGFTPISGSSDIIVVTNSASKIVAPSFTACAPNNVFNATLTVDGIALKGRSVDFTINGKTYSRITDSKGVAGLAIGLKKGYYTVAVSFAGETNVNKASVSSTVLSITNSTSKIVAPPVVGLTSSNNVLTATLTVDGVALKGKTVAFTINGKTYSKTTNSNGVASLEVGLKKGEYPVTVSYAGETNIKKASVSSSVIRASSAASKLVAPAYTAYVNFKNVFTATLTVDGFALANRAVGFTINGKTYTQTTNSKGVASLDIGLRKGSYPVTVSFAGEKNVNKASVSSKITVLDKMPKVLTRLSTENYVQGTPGQFKVKLTNARGALLKNSAVTFTINSATYTKKTDSNGIATLDINLKSGTYSITVASPAAGNYAGVSKTFSFKVESNDKGNGGFWVFGRDMNSVNLNTLKSYGTKHIFLNFKALELHGQSAVESFIQKANSNGIKVHIWMQVFYDGDWPNPVKNGELDYDLINSKIALAKSYAKIKGVSGVHMDYLRYPGTAYKYPKATEAINYFTQKVCSQIHAINPNLIVSAAIMPEPSQNVYYYGQDIPTLTKYLDVIIPMVYKGNYNQDTSWIKQTTQTIVKQSSGAKVWVGLQSYRSDSNPTRLSVSELFKDAQAATSGGADGIIMFRFGLSNLINFNKL